MLKYPLTTDTKDLDSLIKEFTPLVQETKREHPDFNLKTKAVQKFIFLNTLLKTIEQVIAIDPKASLTAILNSKQDITLISNAFAVTFAERFSLPNDLTVNVIKQLVSALIAYNLVKNIEEVFSFYGSLNGPLNLKNGLKNIIKFGNIDNYPEIKAILNLIMSNKEIDEIKPLI